MIDWKGHKVTDVSKATTTTTKLNVEPIEASGNSEELGDWEDQGQDIKVFFSSLVPP